MNKEILYEILKSKSEKLSAAEIESIMNEELDKSTSTMDTDLIDLCLEALESAEKEQLNKRRVRLKVSKILIAAVIFVLIIGIAIPTCAKHFNVTIPEGIVTFYSDCFNVDLSQDEYIDDLLGQLEQDGIESVVLPKTTILPETKISNYSCNYDNDVLYVKFSFSTEEFNGYVTMSNSYFKNGDSPILKVNDTYGEMDYYDVNGISVLVFCKDDCSLINYSVNGIDYNISLNCDYETACQIAKTL